MPGGAVRMSPVAVAAAGLLAHARCVHGGDFSRGPFPVPPGWRRFQPVTCFPARERDC